MRLDIYNNVDTKTILDAIKLDENKIPRIRGVGIDNGKILIHTRTGGGNRESYDDAESYIDGDYGLTNSLKELEKALTDYSDSRWLTRQTQYENNDWNIPYEVLYTYPETDAEWDAKEAEIKENIESLKESIKEVQETNAYTNDYMRDCEYFEYDEDDDWDSTYANFWFTIPQELTDSLTKLEDPVRKAALGDAKDWIDATMGRDEEAKERILTRIEEAQKKEEQSNE